MTSKTSRGTDQTIDAILGTIAINALGIETLETRFSGSLDFHEVSVWQLRQALRAAFDAGKQHA